MRVFIKNLARKDADMRMPSAVLFLGLTFASLAQGQPVGRAVNPSIDMQGFLRVSMQAAEHREARRISEADFIRMSREPGTIVLDARSRQRFDELHVRGAINLSFPDITVESLQKTIPDRNTRILIYCNNNFSDAEGPFPSKLPSASLNLSTYIALYNYGYHNVYELADTFELKASRLAFASSPRR
jgi:phage shock protein E